VNSVFDGFDAANDATAWQFGSTTKGGEFANFIPYSKLKPSSDAPGVDCLVSERFIPGGDFLPFACKFNGPDTVTGASSAVYRSAPWINLTPGPGPPSASTSNQAIYRRQSVARFTIPSDGQWHIIAVWDGDTRSTTSVTVNKNGVKLDSGSLLKRPFSSDGGTIFDQHRVHLTFPAVSNDKIDFLVGDLGSTGNDWTYLHARVIKAIDQSTTCKLGKQGCNTHCQDVYKDEDHCGQCGHKCKDSEHCCDGVCHDLTFDKENCGACSHRCIEPTPYCTKGLCHQ